MNYQKPSKSLQEQLEILRGRGLSIPDQNTALMYLKNIGYFRLAGYSLAFQVNHNLDGTHTFIENTSFEDVVGLYLFDRNLRLITIDALERIEVGLKAEISQSMSQIGGPHWYMETKFFYEKFNYQSFLEILKKELGHDDDREGVRHVFVQHYYQKYTNPELPPSWMIFEVLSLGKVSMIFKNINREYQREIAEIYGLRGEILVSWLHSLSYLRNLAAHHQRLWNRTYTIKPSLYKKLSKDCGEITQDRFYAQAVVIQVLLKSIAPQQQWKESLVNLFKENPSVDIRRLGFPLNWLSHQVWR